MAYEVVGAQRALYMFWMNGYAIRPMVELRTHGGQRTADPHLWLLMTACCGLPPSTIQGNCSARVPLGVVLPTFTRMGSRSLLRPV